MRKVLFSQASAQWPRREEVLTTPPQLSQFGLAGDACVPPHCVNKLQDADESEVDCGGSCGSVTCPNRGCLEEGSVWAISVKGGIRMLERGLYHGTCLTYSGSYERTMQATLRNGALEVEDPGFQGTYPVIQNREDGFTAEKSDLFGDNYSCGFADTLGYGLNKSGRVTINVRCASRTAIFSAECYSDAPADGCYPNYTENVRGSGPQLLCTAGHVPVGGACVDVDECATSPCGVGETCTNLDGSYLCSCDAPSKRCDALCANVTNDPQNCGDCGIRCRPDQVCDAAVCGCAAGYADVAGTCVDVDECATGTHDCSPLAGCANTNGSYVCTCNAGYAGDGKSCTDIDECLSGPCAPGEACTNSEGSYSCACPDTRAVCDGACVDPKTDELNCGACDNQCAAGSACLENKCVPWIWSSIEPGQRHTCGIGPQQTLLCWGANDEGQAAPPAGKFAAVSSGVIHSCALRSDSTVACFGSNSVGQSTPPSGTFVALATGTYHSCGLRTDGTISCWGSNWSGELLTPSGTFVALSAGENYSCGLRSDGSLACWGYQGSSSYHPYPVTGTFTAVSASGSISCALRTDKTLSCWGAAAQTPPAGTFSAVSVGSHFGCALRTDGTIACWGSSNYYGQTNAPAGTFVSINAGYSHACALRSDGLPVCWGFNQYGQCNTPTF